MHPLTRRSFVAAGAAIPLSLWIEQSAAAPTKPEHVRHDARSAKGKAMLKIYADAVGKMKAAHSSDPTSWVFQWYTHWVQGAQQPYAAALKAKNDAIAQIFPGNQPNPNRDLAGEMWSNCEAHGLGFDPNGEGMAGFPPQVEDYFLPWHRLFVLHFEQIIRAVSGKTEFTLPYWNYSTADRTIRGVIPPEFTKQNDPLFGPLYVENRNPGVNQGESIEKVAEDMGITNALDLDALLQQVYSFTSQTVQGFDQTLDFGLHGNVHVAVGSDSNMGSIPSAANDPVFWMHHCNIDRLWASWNAGGRINPSMNQQFIFADGNGKRVVTNISEVLDLAKLDYTYDHLERVSGATQSLEAAFVRRRGEKVRASAARISLSQSAVHTPLALAPGVPGEAARSIAARAESLDASGRIFLVVRDLQTDASPNTLYALYLDLPANSTVEQKKAHAVGAINFFHAHMDQPVGHGRMIAGHRVAASFDITGLVQTLRKAGKLSNKPILSIIPIGKPNAAAKPVVGEISIIEV
jgi:tyrosinase